MGHPTLGIIEWRGGITHQLCFIKVDSHSLVTALSFQSKVEKFSSLVGQYALIAWI